MRENQRFRVVDTRNAKVYKENIENDDVLFFVDPSGNVHKREIKKDLVVMQPVEGFKLLYSVGLFDMNDIEIFEGDIVCEKYEEKDGTINPYYYVAKYDKELFCYGLIDFNDDFTPLGNHSFGIVPEEINDHYEVVGNIYEDDIEHYWKLDEEWNGGE